MELCAHIYAQKSGKSPYPFLGHEERGKRREERGERAEG